jgi:DNA replication protein DnaC
MAGNGGLMLCDKHGEYTPETMTIMGRTLSTGCPECSKEIEAKEAADLEEAKARAAINRLCRFNIEPMYYDCTLENFETPTDDHVKALHYAREIVKTCAGKLVLLGANGTGKTHLAVGVVREIGGAIYAMYEITTRIRASYVSGAKETELDIVDELARLPMLAIDEIGRTKGSEAETNWLSYITDKRHTRGLPLILISNKHTRKTCPSKGCDKCLENYISEDIMSRLNEDGHLITFAEGDYRKKKRAECTR